MLKPPVHPGPVRTRSPLSEIKAMPRHPRQIATRTLPVLITACIAACAPVPDFPAGDAAKAPFPAIVPLNQIQSPHPTPSAHQGINTLAARAAALRSRANQLRRTSVVDAQTQADMQAALGQSH